MAIYNVNGKVNDSISQEEEDLNTFINGMQDDFGILGEKIKKYINKVVQEEVAKQLAAKSEIENKAITVSSTSQQCVVTKKSSPKQVQPTNPEKQGKLPMNDNTDLSEFDISDTNNTEDNSKNLNSNTDIEISEKQNALDKQGVKRESVTEAYSEFVRQYNDTGKKNAKKRFTCKLSIKEEQAQFLSYKSKISDWNELDTEFVKSIVLESNGASTVRYVADLDNNDIKTYYIAPVNNYHPDESEVVQMALLAFFDYSYNKDRFGEDLTLVKPAIFEKDSDGFFHLVSKGIIR